MASEFKGRYRVTTQTGDAYDINLGPKRLPRRAIMIRHTADWSGVLQQLHRQKQMSTNSKDAAAADGPTFINTDGEFKAEKFSNTTAK